MRAVGSFFMVWGSEQKCRTQRLADGEKKNHRLNPPKAVPWKAKLGPKYKWFKNLIFRILFLKILFRAYKVFIFVQTFHWISSDFFFSFRLSSRKCRSQQKLTKKITYFTVQFCLKNLTHFTNLNSFDIENNMLSQHSQKPFWLYKFSANMFLFGIRKNICTAPFLDAQELHSSITLKANVCIFLYISLRNLLFQRRSKVFSGKSWDGGREVARGREGGLRWLAASALQNVLQFFILIDIFENSTIF